MIAIKSTAKRIHTHIGLQRWRLGQRQISRIREDDIHEVLSLAILIGIPLVLFFTLWK